MIGVDTNLLVYAHRALCPEHEEAKTAIEKAAANPSGWGFALPSIAEFWTVVTHPSCEGDPSTPEQAEEFLAALIETGNPTVFVPSESFLARFITTAKELDIRGVRIFDLQIALLAMDAGATEIWTHDSGFIQVPGIDIIDPLVSQNEP